MLELEEALGEALEVWVGTKSERSGVFTCSGNGGCGGAACSTRGGRETEFYRRSRIVKAIVRT